MDCPSIPQQPWLCVLETSVTHSVAALATGLRVLQDERFGAGCRKSQSAQEEVVNERLDKLEEKLNQHSAKTTAIPGDLREGALRAEVSALMLPALTTATDTWAKGLGRALKPVLESQETQGKHMSRLCDELGKIGIDGLKVAQRVQALEAMAKYASPSLHERFLSRATR